MAWTLNRDKRKEILLLHHVDWIEQYFTSPPTQHSIGYMGDGFFQVKRPNQQYQSTERTYSTQINQTYNKQTYKHKTHAQCRS